MKKTIKAFFAREDSKGRDEPSASKPSLDKGSKSSINQNAPAIEIIKTSRPSSTVSTSSSLSRSSRNFKAPSAQDLKNSIRNNLDRPEHLFRKWEYQFIRTLGSGSFAKVSEAVRLESGERVAVKMIDKSKMRNREERLLTEIQILTKVEHKNLLTLIDWGMGSKTIYLVTELCDY
jgi:hypothetical protein